MHPVHAYSFDTTGVAILKTLFTQDQVTQAKDLICSNWPEGIPYKFPVLHLGRIFWEFMTHPTVLELSKQFAGAEFRMDHTFGVTSNNSIPNLHGGPQSSQLSCFYLPLNNGGMRAITGQLNFGVCLMGQTPETGGFCYIAGSHKSQDARAGRELFKEVYKHRFDHHSITVPTLEPGDVIMFSEGLVHGDTGWWNKAPKSYRMQIYYVMTPGFMCWRDPEQIKELQQYTQTDLERRLIAPPWTGRYSETATSMGIHNERRRPTL